MPREICDSCCKPISACICGSITVIDNPTEVLILQHPSEVKHAIGTARIVDLSLKNAELVVGEVFSKETIIGKRLREGRKVVLLFPTDNSQLQDDLSHDDAPHKTTLIVIDGSWRKAKKILHLNSWLLSLPQLKLAVGEGLYTIRKAPKSGYLSTVEAVTYALSDLEGEQKKYQPMLDSFKKMLSFQIEKMGKDIFEKNYNQSE